MDFPEDTTALAARVDAGALTVVVPDGVAVRADTEADNGSVVFFDQNVSGEGVEQDFEEDGYAGADQRLDLDLSVRTGVIEVQREG